MNKQQTAQPPSTGGDAILMGPFELIEFIGEGSMGQVWRGRHRAQGAPAAIKVITRHGSNLERYRRFFRQEVRAVARLHHPGVVMVFDYGEVSREAEASSFGALQAGSPALAMEYCSGGSLYEHLHSLSWTEVRAILLSLLDALAHAHARGVIHRDLKPANILLANNAGAGVRLTDFGLAMLTEHIDEDAGANRDICGTPTYMSPEQLQGEWRDIGPWSDLYSLGCLAYLMACGRPPFDGRSIVEIARKHLHKPIPRLEPRISVPDQFEAWVHRLLQKPTMQRYQRAADAAWGLMLMEQPAGAAEPADSRMVTAARRSSLVLTPLLDLAEQQRERRRATAGTDHKAAEYSQESPVEPLETTCPPLTRDWRHLVHRRPPVKLVGAGLGLYGIRHIPLVGREAEREQLWEATREIEKTREPRGLVLEGGAGCGKSYLAAWFCDRAAENGAIIPFRATHSSGPGGGDGLARMLAERLRTTGLEREELLERLRDRLQAEGVEDPYEWEALCEILSPATEQHVADGQRKVRFSHPEQRYDIVLRALRRIARGRMMALWLDDVHWSAESLAFARYCLSDAVADPPPMLILATVRTETLADSGAAASLRALLDDPKASRVQVEPLVQREQAEFISELLHLEPALGRRVADRTGGNPLFAVQLIGDWVDRGVLRVGREGFVLEAGERPEIPDDIFDVWTSRLGDLLAGASEEVHFAFEIAAALGQEVDFGDWKLCCELAGVELPTDELNTLLTHYLFEDLDDGVRFVHGLLRECLIRRAREADRWTRANHVAAEMLLESSPRTDESAGRLGRYLFAAERFEEALEPLLRAARFRGNRHEHDPALTLLDLRDEALDRLNTPENSTPRVKGGIVRAHALHRVGRADEANALADSVIEMARDLDDAALLTEALFRRAVLDLLQGHYEQAWQRLIALEPYPESLGADIRSRIAKQRGFILMRRARYDEAISALEQSVSFARQAGDYGIWARALSHMGESEFRRGNPEKGRQYLNESIEMDRQNGRALHAAQSMLTLGDILRHHDKLEAAEDVYRRVYADCINASPHISLVARLNLGIVRLQGGEFKEAHPDLIDCENAYRRRGHRVMLAFARCILLPCLVEREDWESFDEMLTFVVEVTEEMGVHDIDLAICAEMAGDLALGRNAYGPALSTLKLALRQWNGVGKDDRARATQQKLDEIES